MDSTIDMDTVLEIKYVERNSTKLYVGLKKPKRATHLILCELAEQVSGMHIRIPFTQQKVQYSS